VRRKLSKGTLQELKWGQGKMMCLSKAIFASKKRYEKDLLWTVAIHVEKFRKKEFRRKKYFAVHSMAGYK
jgi:hypothetical protein